MKKLWIVVIGLVALMLAACSAPIETEPLPETDVEGYPPAEPAGEDFRSDPPEAVSATGRPQLIEFYTVW